MIETRLWYQNAPFGWYFFRIMAFLFFIITTYALFNCINGRIIGGVLTIYLTTFSFWSDIFGRLGTAEVYTAIGTAVFIIGILILCRSNYQVLALLLMTLGVIISIGSKENMVILLMPHLYYLFIYRKDAWKKRILSIFSAIICTLWTSWVYLKLFNKIKISKTDAYNNTLELSTRLQIVNNYLIEHKEFLLLVGGLIFLIILGVLFRKHKGITKWYMTLIVSSVFIVILIISQIFFYNGQLIDRYNFPYMLYTPLVISLACYEIQQLFSFANKEVFGKIIIGFLVIGLILIIRPNNWQKIHQLSVSNLDRSIVFANKIKQIERFLEINPNYELVIYGNEAALDYEPILSYARFIRAESLQNKIYVIRDPDVNFESTYKGLALILEKLLIEYSQNGYSDWDISPISTISNNPENCILATLLTTHPSPYKCNTVIDGNLFIK
jgi:hypothetical protein